MNADISRAVTRCHEQLDWMGKLADQAERHFWNTADVEFAQYGAVTENPRDVADALCADAASPALIALAEAALVCGVEFDYGTPSHSLAATRTLTPSAVSTVSSAIKAILARVFDLSYPPVGGLTHPPIQATGEMMFEQIAGFLTQLGTKFASPITAFYPDTGVTGISAEVAVGDLTQLKLLLVGGVWPAGAGWHQMQADDVVVLTSVAIPEISTIVNVPMVVVSITEGAVPNDLLTLQMPGALEALEPTPSTTVPTKPGDLFVLRKIRGVEA